MSYLVPLFSIQRHMQLFSSLRLQGISFYSCTLKQVYSPPNNFGIQFKTSVFSFKKILVSLLQFIFLTQAKFSISISRYLLLSLQFSDRTRCNSGLDIFVQNIDFSKYHNLKWNLTLTPFVVYTEIVLFFFFPVLTFSTATWLAASPLKTRGYHFWNDLYSHFVSSEAHIQGRGDVLFSLWLLSQQHSMSGLWGDLRRLPQATPLLKEGRWEQVAPDLDHLGFACLQGCRLHRLSGEPVPMFDPPRSKKVFSCV